MDSASTPGPVPRNSATMRKALCAIAPRSFTLRRRLHDGTIVAGPNRRGFGGRGVFVLGDEIEPELGLLDVVLSPGDTMIDVGGNSGVYALKAATRVGPSGCVLALEPNPEMLGILFRNVRRNNFEHVRVRGLAASDSIGYDTLYTTNEMPNSFSLVRSSTSKGFSVPTTTIDEIVDREGLQRVDLIKIDVEGAEDRVLAGARGTLQRFRPLVIAEMHKGGITSLPDGYEAFRRVDSPNICMVTSNSSALSLLAQRAYVAALMAQ